MLAATPAWFADNLAQISGGTLLVLTILVIRVVQKVVIRAALLVLIAAVGLFVYANRDELKTCAKTCECDIAGTHVTVPTCRSDIEL
ncbi:MAG: hypothetical protein ACT4OV_01505 [Microthrixaceae bacterium]